MFGDLTEEKKEKSSFKISYLRVAKYNYELYLKTIAKQKFNSNNSTGIEY